MIISIIHQTEKEKLKTKLRFSKKYIITTSNDESFEILGLRDFAKEYNLNHSALTQVAKGKYKSHRGYICKHMDE